ncbi:PAS domain-containing sensor histidine kinase [Paraburkholderia diazotrophica]|uniref:PAS domain-containing sensor histidine kinase n=1 Tax=Paraburkholderia diazotrophica TaxID=667676 RepID=UPI00316EB663
MDRLSSRSRTVISVDATQVFELLPDAWLILDERCEVVAANARYREMHGVTLADIQGCSIHDINQVGPQSQRELRRSWLDSLLAGLVPGEPRLSSLIRYDTPAPDRSDGTLTPRYWQARASMIEPSDGRAPLIAMCMMDVTESLAITERDQREREKLRSQVRRRQVLVDEANAELRMHREQLRQALEFAHVGAWELDPATGTIDATEQCKINLGLSASDALTEQRLFDELIDDADRARVKDAMQRALARREHFEVEFRVTWPDLTVRWVLLRGLGRYRDDNTLKSTVGFTLDITSRKESELEQRAIAESEKRARKHSDEAARAMDRFVTAVSHELRSPLGAILSWTTLLQRAADPAHVTRAAGVIERNAHQLAHMVDDLLDSGAIATGKLSVNLQPVDLGALAGNVAEDMRMSAEAKGLRFVVGELAPCIVMADESRMKQVAWNLLSNAVKFCAQGEVELSVTVKGQQAELSVRDTGCGIEPDALTRIFERFRQVDPESGGRVAGLGLGLWLVKHLVDLHHGTVVAESAGRGEGSTFRVTLPLYR